MVIRKKLDALAAGCLLAAMGFAYLELEKVENLLNYALGPAFVPRLLVVVIAVLSLVLLFQSIDFGAAAKPGEQTGINRKTLGLQVCLVFLLVLYIAVLPWIGYVAATVLFMFVAMLLLGKKTCKDVAMYLLASGITTALLYYVFAKLLLLFLP